LSDMGEAVKGREGVVYACGEWEQGQLGLPRSSLSEASSVPTSGTLISDKGSTLPAVAVLDEHDNVSRPVAIPALLAGHHVLRIGAGGDHSLFLTDTGRVLACGRNDSFQLGVTPAGPAHLAGGSRLGGSKCLQDGHEGREAGPEPQQVSSLRWIKVVDMACGDAHNLVRCLDGSVYSWGLGTSGRLGLGDFKSVPQPCKVSALEGRRCVSVAAGYYHSLALMEDGKLFSWGNGTGGQLGTGKFESSCVPVEVEEPGNGQRWKAVGAGEYHTVCMTDVDSLWSWGLNNDGQLGHGDQERSGRPKVIRELVGSKFSQFSCGPNFNVAISNGSQVRRVRRVRDGFKSARSLLVDPVLPHLLSFAALRSSLGATIASGSLDTAIQRTAWSRPSSLASGEERIWKKVRARSLHPHSPPPASELWGSACARAGQEGPHMGLGMQ